MGLGEDIQKWLKSLPRSRMERPSSFIDWLKYGFWLVYTPLHPFVRDLATGSRVVRHTWRQQYLLGKLNPERNVREFAEFLVSQGFGNHFVAWKDPGELFGLRRTDGFHRQYHIRVFEDGEVRGHYEYTTEYRPYQHLVQIGFEDRTEEFLELLQEWIVPASELQPAAS